MSTFYTYYGLSPNYCQKHKTQLVEDFEKYLKNCIGAVAIYRLIIDPLPLLLNEQDIAMRAPAFFTKPYGESFINNYIDERVIDAYKQTDIYQEYYEELSAREKQNESVYNLIHYQAIDRNKIKEYLEQAHLLSEYDKLALIISLSSNKISNCYLMNGLLGYFTEVQSLRENVSLTLGNQYYQGFFLDNNNYNLPFDNIYISRCKAFGETHYFEHNEPLIGQEIDLIEQNVSEINNNHEEAIKQLDDILINSPLNNVILTIK